MLYKEFRSANEAYHQLTDMILANGIEYHPRGQDCVECRPAAYTITNARKGIYYGKSRKLNYAFMAAEAMMYVAGIGGLMHAEILTTLAPNTKQFLNANGTFDGAYGPRLASSLPTIFEQFTLRDTDSRQCVAPIWEPGLLHQSVETKSKDVPCTISLQFLRDRYELALLTNMRSNDMNWGFPYDTAAFCIIQCAMADCLKVHAGKYHHVAGSLHVYTSAPGLPKTKPHEEEEFHVYGDIPRHYYSKWELFSYHAATWVNHLHYDIVHGLPLRDFTSAMESREMAPDSAGYWKFWSNLIRDPWLSERVRCVECGSAMERTGCCFKCANCGSVFGCS